MTWTCMCAQLIDEPIFSLVLFCNCFIYSVALFSWSLDNSLCNWQNKGIAAADADNVVTCYQDVNMYIQMLHVNKDMESYL